MKSSAPATRLIVFADDDVYQSHSYVEELRRHGYDVIPASSVDAALALLKTKKVAVLVTDLMMFHGNSFGEIETSGGFKTGLALARKIGRMSPSTHVILLSNSRISKSDLDKNGTPDVLALWKPKTFPPDLPKFVEQVLAKKPRQIKLPDRIRLKRTPNRSFLFISYSHIDKKWLQELRITLKPYIRDRQFSIWDDTQIEKGDEWRKSIGDALSGAKVAVLLVSRYFFGSAFIVNNELPRLLLANKRDGLRILWIPVSDSPYTKSKIAKFTALYDPARPLDKLSKAERASAFVKIANEIEKAMMK